MSVKQQKRDDNAGSWEKKLLILHCMYSTYNEIRENTLRTAYVDTLSVSHDVQTTFKEKHTLRKEIRLIQKIKIQRNWMKISLI